MTTTDDLAAAMGLIGGLLRRSYPTRDAAFASLSNLTDGTRFTADGVPYIRRTGGGAFADLGGADVAAVNLDVDAFGNTRNAAMIQAALNEARDLAEGGNGVRLRFAQGQSYAIADPLALTFAQNAVAGFIIDGAGAQIVSSIGSSEGALFTLTNRAVVRHVTLNFPTIIMGGDEDEGIVLDGGADASGQFLYNIAMGALQIAGCAGASALHLKDNVFEIDLYSPQIDMTGQKASGAVITASGGAVSSVRTYGGTLRGGLRNVYLPVVTDLTCFGTTFLNSGEELVKTDNSIGDAFIGCHFENAWDNGGAQAIKPMLSLTNQPKIIGGTFQGSTGTATHAIELFVTGQGALVQEPTVFGNVTKTVYVKGALGGATVRTSGVPRARIDYIDAAAQRSTSVQYGADVINSAAATGTVAVDLDSAQLYEFEMTGDLTVSNPTNQKIGDRLTMRFKQDGTGGHSLTLPGLCPTLKTMPQFAGGELTVEWYWTGGSWSEIGPAQHYERSRAQYDALKAAGALNPNIIYMIPEAI